MACPALENGIEFIHPQQGTLKVVGRECQLRKLLNVFKYSPYVISSKGEFFKVYIKGASVGLDFSSTPHYDTPDTIQIFFVSAAGDTKILERNIYCFLY